MVNVIVYCLKRRTLSKGERIGIILLHKDNCRECLHCHMNCQMLTMNANKTKFLLTHVGAIIANTGQ